MNEVAATERSSEACSVEGLSKNCTLKPFSLQVETLKV